MIQFVFFVRRPLDGVSGHVRDSADFLFNQTSSIERTPHLPYVNA